MAKLLIVDDEDNIRKVLKQLLARNGFTDIIEAADGVEALEKINDNEIDLVISDINMPKMDGITLFEKAKKLGPVFIILTAFGSIETAVNMVKSGVYDFISKPFDESELVNTVKKAVSERCSSNMEIQYSGGIDEIFFQSRHPEIEKINSVIDRVATTGGPVFITGETGTGKGLLAGIIHEKSGRQGAFIKVNCAAIPETLMESELFGYRKGAFTGAAMDKPGKFELAAGGTIFLDEIGELPNELQAKLLAALQDKEINRLGDTKPVKIDARVIAATNINIKEAIEKKTFREDLYYRLNVVEFAVPPLRERGEDAGLFINFFNKKYSDEYGIEQKKFSEDAVEYISECKFAGNIRELENVIQKLLIMEKDAVVTKEVAARYLSKAECKTDNSLMFRAGKDKKVEAEVSLIRQALEKTEGNRTKAAEILGISRRTLLYRIKEYGIA
ncbi:MAG: sigma-54-dependent Fis family transcriptional regulator [Candidatus Goldbacteria bacterium]|nr:sigma-54-dependent Fis family transcriptional regulator [Candidatus Goldiibacteriota bacterium]